MSKGDHIVIVCCFYTHHGIDTGRGTVIQYNGKEIKGQDGTISEVPMNVFTDGQPTSKIKRMVYLRTYFSPDDILKRAKSKLGEQQYNLIFRNCEHFATWCCTNKWYSDQVVKFIARPFGGSFSPYPLLGRVISKTKRRNEAYS